MIFLRRLDFCWSVLAAVRSAVATPVAAAGLSGSWTGLKAWVAAVSSSVSGMVAVSVPCSASLRALTLARSVSGLKAAATGVPPFMKARMSLLKADAVAYRFWRSLAMALAQMESHIFGRPGTMVLGGVATSVTCW